MPTLATVAATIDRGRAATRASFNSPRKFACDDGEVYVVKANSHDRQFANELLAFGFAVLLDVPVFDAALVQLSSAFINSSPALANQYTPGINFGSQVPNRDCFDAYAASPSLINSQVYNVADIYRLAMYDEVIHNSDRAGNPGNMVFVRSRPAAPEFEFRAIDHGHAFTGPTWSPNQLSAHVPAPLVPVLAATRDLLTSKAELLRTASAVAGAANRYKETIETARAGLTNEEQWAVLKFVERRSAELSNWVIGPVYSSRLPSLC